MKRKFRAGNKIKIFSAIFAISLLSISIISFDSAFAKPDDLPRQARAQIPDNQSNERPQFVSAMGKVQGKDLNVHIWVLVPHGVDKNEVVKQALAKHGAQPDFVSEKFSTTGLYWDQFGDESNLNDFVTQNYNPSNDPPGGLDALLNTHTTWNNVGTSSFVFDYGGITNRCPSLVPECYPFPNTHLFDGYNDVAWLPLDESNVLGVTWSGTSTDEADMAMNTNFSWNTNGDYVDIETVLLHENGHVAGLGHSNDGEAVMYPSYHGVLRFLQSDDIDGISSLYPYFEPPTIVIYEDDMESGTNGWTTSGATGLWHQSTNRENSPTTSWYYGQEGVFNYDTGDNSGFLTSPKISLDGATSAGLEFYEWSSMENGPDWDRTRVQASSDGSSWTTVFESHETFGSWEKREVSLNSFVGGDVYIQFWFDTIDGQFNNFEGWYVDDIKVLVDNTNTIPNIPPTADAGGDQTVDENTSVNLDGILSDDPDGDVVIYAWTQTVGTTVTLTGANTATPSFTAPSVGASGKTLTFSLIVTDNDGASSIADTVDINVNDVPVPNIPPTADAGGDQTVDENTSVNLDGILSDDPDGDVVIYAWTQTVGTTVTLTGANTATPSFTAPSVGASGETLTFSLIVTDNDGASSIADTVDINVNDVPVPNIPPTADAGGDQTVVQKTTITLNGSESFDPNGDPLTYEWIKISGPKVNLVGEDTAEPEFTAPKVGKKGKTLEFQLTVSDGISSSTDNVKIFVTQK